MAVINMDCIAGSGSTGKAARMDGYQFMGFEMSAAIANGRIYD